MTTELALPIGGAAIPHSQRPLVVVIVTYKSHDLVEQCLASVAEHLPGLPVYVYENTGDGISRSRAAGRPPPTGALGDGAGSTLASPRPSTHWWRAHHPALICCCSMRTPGCAGR